MEVVKNLAERFVSLRYLQGMPGGRRMGFFEALANKYNEGHRRYHTLRHIADCFEVFDKFRHLADNPHVLDVAIFTHDLFYDIGVPTRQNEEKSALFLTQWMFGWGCLERDVYLSMSAVLATTHDHTPSTSDNKLMVDIDLAGLGASWEKFLENNTNVREEYKHVPENKFRAGNATILQRFLDRTPLYYFPEIEEEYGAQAKDNLRRWLSRP